MLSKAEVIAQNLKGLRVLDIGGCGYGEGNAYERQLSAAWKLAASRTTLDWSDRAEIRVDLNAAQLPPLTQGPWDITTAFDVLEHLENPANVLRWIPTSRLLVNLPNGRSCFARRMEEKGKFEHLYSFTPYTASVLLGRGGWKVERVYPTMGKWSLASRLVNLAGTFCPLLVGTGIMLHCSRVKSG